MEDTKQTFDIEDPAFDNSSLVTFISGITANRIVLIGTKNNNAINLDASAYTALEGLGMTPGTTFGIRSAFAMVTIKGNTAETS